DCSGQKSPCHLAVQFDPDKDRNNHQNEPLNDKATFARYSRGFTDIHAWRRDNVNLFIKQISDSIAQAKPHVKFGISPTGIWRNRKEDPRGSHSNVPMTSYDGVYADVRKWLQAGWIDYVAPQLYWSTTHPTADYDALLPWWNANSFGRHLYIGQGLFKTVNTEKYKRWKDPRQFALQLKLNRQQRHVKGSIYYNASSFKQLSPEVERIIQAENHKHLSLIPPMIWKDSIPPLKPANLKITPLKGLPRLSWQTPEAATDGQKPSYYVVYRFRPDEKANLEDASHIMAISRRQEWIDLNCKQGERYLYVVTSVDRLHNESMSGEAILYDSNKPISSLTP
ncbi:MAG: family 10 glycosylhydrolase, partial [Bacteroidota bacterium]